MQVYLLVEAEVRKGVFEHEFLNIINRTDTELQEIINNFVQDLYAEGYEEFKQDKYTITPEQFGLLHSDQSVILNDNMYLSLAFGVGSEKGATNVSS